MPTGRIVIIPFLHGKLTDDDTLIEPDVDAILERWLDRHPEFRGKKFHIIRSGKYPLDDHIVTTLVCVTTDFSPDLEGYNAADDADLYEEFLAEVGGSARSGPHKIWTEQCEAARSIEDDFGVPKALGYLIGEKFLNFLEVAETDADFRAEIPAFVEMIKTIFEPWQLAQYLETARQTEPFDPELFEPRSSYLLGEEEIEFDAEEVEELRKDDIRQCTRDLLLVERAREWLLEEENCTLAKCYGGCSSIMVRRPSRYSHRDVRDLIQRSLEDCPEFGSRVEVEGKLNRIAEGIWHDNYWFWIRGRDLSDERTEQAYVLRLLEQHEDWQEGPEPRERLVREAETLQALKKSNFAYPTPTFMCFVRDSESEAIGMIETGLPGYSLGRFKDRSTLRVVSRAAADIHRLEIEKFAHLPSSNSRAEHVKSRLAELDEALFAEFPLANEVRQWIAVQTPSNDRSCVLHGDLLPQNLLCDLPTSYRKDATIGVVDWEMARVGDPAYDLAIVSRGNRKVLGVTDGLKVLVEDYLEFGGQPVSLADVRVHEFLLLLYWLEESWRESQKSETRGHGPDHYEAKLQSLFRRTAN